MAEFPNSCAGGETFLVYAEEIRLTEMPGVTSVIVTCPYCDREGLVVVGAGRDARYPSHSAPEPTDAA